MVAMMQHLDSRSLFFYSNLIGSTFLALVLKILWNCFRCHSLSLA